MWMTRLALCLFVALPLSIRADEALRKDGTRAAGELSFDNGRFALRTSSSTETSADLELVRFDVQSARDHSELLWHQVNLLHGQVVRGELLRLDADQLYLRSIWSRELSLPRAGIERVRHLPGEQAALFDPFDGDLAGWKTAGDVRLDRGKLAFAAADQAVAWLCREPIASGRVAVAFTAKRTTSRRIQVELGFERNQQTSTVTVELLGPDEHYRVTGVDESTPGAKTPRGQGERRLSAEFADDHLYLFVDDRVLWSQRFGPGKLRSIRLFAAGAGGERGEIDGILVTRRRPRKEPESWADLSADGVRTIAGAENFGRLTALTPRYATLAARGRDSLLPWTDIEEVTFRRAPRRERPTTGEHVQVRLCGRNGACDILEGAVRSFGADSLTLDQQLLGVLVLPRAHIAEIRFGFFGRTVPIDATPRHLGKRSRFGFAVTKPEGLNFEAKAAINVKAAAGHLCVDAAFLDGRGTPLEAFVNGRSIGNLNRLADRAEATERTYRLPLPALEAGEVKIELRLQPKAPELPVDSVDVRAVRLELHDTR